jgi:3-oxoacyl-[acyl-carrier-protein] synthase III
MSRPVFVVGSGTYLPGPPIPFEEIGSVLGDLPQAPRAIQRWLRSTAPVMQELLAIDYVHYAFDGQRRRFTDDNVSMAVAAAKLALDRAGLEPADIDLICYASAQLNHMPTTSVRIQAELGLERCEELCFHANCTGPYKALHVATQLVRHGCNERALVLSSNISSSELVAEYYNQALVDKESLFLRWFLCDGAGAVVVSSSPTEGAQSPLVESTYLESVGGRRSSLMFNRRPTHYLNPRDVYDQGLHHLRQRFRDALATEVFQEEGGSIFYKGLCRMLERADVPLQQIRFLQVNMPTKHIVMSIMEECAALGISGEALFTKLDSLGYCGPPMALISLDQMLRDEPLEPGDRVVSFVTEVSKFMQAGYVLHQAPGLSGSVQGRTMLASPPNQER